MIYNRNLSLPVVCLTLAVTLLLSGCKKKTDEAEKQEPQPFATGTSSGENVFFSDLKQPLNVWIDEQHKHTLELDVNNDFTVDYRLISEEKWDLNRNPAQLISKDLRLEILNNNWVVDDASSKNSPAILNINQDLTDPALTWSSSDEMIIAGNYTNIPSQNRESWNGISQKYIGLKVTKEGITWVAWLELSIDAYDNYTMHNYASKQL